MKERSDFDRVLIQWIDEGPSTMPDRVVDVVAGRIARQRQRRPWRLPWRLPQMNTNLRLAAGLATVAVIAVVGWQLLPGRGGPGGPPSPAPSQSSAPTASPSGSVVFPSWYTTPGNGSGILPAGDRATQRWFEGSTFTVPEGWVNDTDHAEIYSLFPDSTVNATEFSRVKELANSILLVKTIANNMFAFCDQTGLFQGATAAEVIGAIVANEAISSSAPVEVTIDGTSGMQVDVQLNPAWTGSCPPSADNPTKDYLDSRNRVIVLDAAGGRTIGIGIGSTYSADFESFLADAMPVIESFNFKLP